jgi:hypothetical protein
MSKKKGFRTALATILVVLVIFAALTFAAIKYFLPVYQVSQSEVYSWAVKIYPLLIGITLIVIASLLGKDNKEDESEEDKLPPNSYDAQLFEQPKDDPEAKAKKPVKPATAVPTVKKETEPLSDEVLSEFVSIFSDEPEKEPEPAPAPVETPEPVEEAEEPEISPFDEIEPEEETEEVEEVEEEPAEEPEAEEDIEEETEEPEVEEEAEQPAEEAAPAPAPVEEKEDSNKALVSAINALVEKMDDFTTAMIYGSEDDEEDEEEYEDEYEPEEEEPVEETAEEPEKAENDYEEHFARIEQQISSLSEIVAKLSDDLKNLPKQVVVAPAPVAEPEVKAEEPAVEPEATPVVEPTPEPAPEPEIVPEPVAEPAPAPVAPVAPVDTTGEQIYKEYEGSNAKQTAMAEFDSANDFGYDLTIAKVAAPYDTVSLQMTDGQCVENGDSTLVIIPFANSEEAKEALDKLDVPYEVSTKKAGSKMSFEDFAKDWIN